MKARERAEAAVECSCPVDVYAKGGEGGEHWRKCPVTRVAAALEEVMDEVLEEAALVADGCWHGPGDHGCDHGREIADRIRALKTLRKEPA